MPARHYAQFLDASDPDQSADDDFRIAQAPPEILRGSFRIHYIPREDSSYGSPRYLLSVQLPSGQLAFAVEPASVDSEVTVRVNGTPFVTTGPITFSASQELELVFCAPDGTITLAGATTGDGLSVGASPWNVAGSILRLGGNVAGADLARGYVSLPYAVPGAPLPAPLVINPGELDFSDPADAVFITVL
jgi:hypothetical protein